jgi:hypothetical protein
MNPHLPQPLHFIITLCALLLAVAHHADAQPLETTGESQPAYIPELTTAAAQAVLQDHATVSLHLRNVKFPEALQALSKDLGVPVEIGPSSNAVEAGEPPLAEKRVTIESNHEPLWVTLEKLTDALGQPVTLLIDHHLWMPMPKRLLEWVTGITVTTAGVPLYLMHHPGICERTTSVDLTTVKPPTDANELKISLLLGFDPRLPIVAPAALQLDHVLDDKGAEIAVNREPIKFIDLNAPHTKMLAGTLWLIGDRRLHKLARIDGTLQAIVMADSTPWDLTVADLAQVTKEKPLVRHVDTNVGSIDFKLEPYGNGRLLALRANGPRIGLVGGHDLPAWGLDYNALIHAYNREGQEIASWDGIGNDTEGGRLFAIIMLKGLSDHEKSVARLVITLPTVLYRLSAPITLNDLAMPHPLTAPAAMVPLTIEQALQRAGGPRWVTINSKADPQTIFRELSRQTGLDIAFLEGAATGGALPALKLPAGRQMFWPLLREIMRQWKLVITWDTERVLLVPATARENGYQTPLHGPLGHNAGCLVVATSLVRRQDTMIPAGAALPDLGELRDDLQLQLKVAMDPALYPLEPLEVTTAEARTDTGQTLPLMSVDYRTVHGAAGDATKPHLWLLNTELQPPPPHCRELVSLKGSLSFNAVIRHDTWAVTDLQKLPQTRCNTVTTGSITYTETYTIEQVSTENDELTIQISCTNRPRVSTGLTVPVVPVRYLAQFVRLFDAAGHQYPAPELIDNKDDENNTTFRLRFYLPDLRFYLPNLEERAGHGVPALPELVGADAVRWGPPARLELRLPAEIQPVTVPFAFRHLPLPF